MSREAADKRLERLLVMIPWISSHEGPTVEEVCQRFELNEADLASELEMLFMCGLYPFTPDTLIEADIVDGRVWIRFADAFERPPTFTRQEAVSLVAAASAVLELPDNQNNFALKSALSKLAEALGINDPDVVDVELAAAPTGVLDMARTAVRYSRTIEIDYYSYGRNAWSRRSIDPYRVFNSEGQWYVQGWAPEVQQLRNFRLDRMRNVEMTERSFKTPDDVPEARVYEPRPDDPEVVLHLDAQAAWVGDQYPIESSQRTENGGLTVRMKVSEPVWLERLLLRLGTHAKVVAGDIDIAGAAERLLRRYDDPNSSGDASPSVDDSQRPKGQA